MTRVLWGVAANWFYIFQSSVKELWFFKMASHMVYTSISVVTPTHGASFPATLIRYWHAAYCSGSLGVTAVRRYANTPWRIPKWRACWSKFRLISTQNLYSFWRVQIQTQMQCYSFFHFNKKALAPFLKTLKCFFIKIKMSWNAINFVKVCIFTNILW